MNLNIFNTTNLKKHLFTLKAIRKDGLILQVQHSKDKELNVRFTNACFNDPGCALVGATTKGDIYVIDFTQNKFWSILNSTLCSILKFSLRNDNFVIIGLNNGLLNITDINTGEIIGKLVGHLHPVINLSFSSDFLCVSSSNSEAIVWDLRSNTKIQVLSLCPNTLLKQVLFMPVSNNVLAYFNDDTIHIWKYGTFEYLKQITPASWNKFHVKCITFTRNGRIMVLGGHSSNLAVFSLDTWALDKALSFSNHFTSIKKISFVCQPFDGGANKILCILTSNGTILFYNMHSDTLYRKLALEFEICKYETSLDGKYLVCLLTSGSMNIYLLAQYTTEFDTSPNEQIKVNTKSKLSLKKSNSILNNIKEKINDVLNIERLHTMLKEFGEYPEAYRLKIWSQLLCLPNNQNLYNALINIDCDVPICDLEKKYPLGDKIALKNLKRLLINLINWCQFFGEVDYMALFAFPFVKIFKNEPIMCFETVCTIIINWCQYWFEYFPLPPINILGMIENILLEHNPSLLDYFVKNDITSKIYGWSILQTLFSEILTANDWLILWDHILSNEPSYIIFTVVAYNIINNSIIIKINNIHELEQFYHSPNLVDVKKLITKAYQLLNNTSEKNHPRQYLNFFKPIELNIYPHFIDYPRAMINYQDQFKKVKQTKKIITQSEEILTRESQIKMDEIKKNIEENARIRELDAIYKIKLEDEIAIVEQQRKKLEKLNKAILIQEEKFKKDSGKMSVAPDSIQNYKQKVKTFNIRSDSKDHFTFDTKAVDKVIKKLQIELKKQSIKQNSDVNIQHLAEEAVALEMQILNELHIIKCLKEQPNVLFRNDDFALLKHTMTKIDDGYQARCSSPV